MLHLTIVRHIRRQRAQQPVVLLMFLFQSIQYAPQGLDLGAELFKLGLEIVRHDLFDLVLVLRLGGAKPRLSPQDHRMVRIMVLLAKPVEDGLGAQHGRLVRSNQGVHLGHAAVFLGRGHRTLQLRCELQIPVLGEAQRSLRTGDLSRQPLLSHRQLTRPGMVDVGDALLSDVCFDFLAEVVEIPGKRAELGLEDL